MKKPVISTLTVALDIGYGVTKAITPGQAPVLFPSVCGHARTIKFRADELADRYPGDQVTELNGDWFVGDLALSQVPTGELLRLRGRAAREDASGHEFRIRMVKAALGKLFVGHYDEALDLRIATGLPVDYMPRASELKKALLGRHRIQTDAADLDATITDVMVMPQPYGTIYAQQLTESGEVNRAYTATRTGVVDVGTYTVDLALDRDGEYIDEASGSVEGGVWTAQQRLESFLEETYGQKPAYRDVEALLRTGQFIAYGEPVDYAVQVEETLEPLRSATLNLMQDKWQTGVHIDVIYVTGGGAELVYPCIRRVFKQARLAENAQLANCQGYLRWALLAARDTSDTGK